MNDKIVPGFIKRFNTDFSKNDYNILLDTADKLNIKRSDVVRRAVLLLWNILAEKENGWKLMFVKGSETKEVTIILDKFNL
jgi:hypothetical protein